MSDSQVRSTTPPKYGMKLYLFEEKSGTWPTKDDKGLTDIINFNVIKAPMSKTSAFATLAVNMPTEYFISLQEYTRRNNLQLCEICIYTVTPYDTPESGMPTPVDNVCCKQYLILNCESLEPVSRKPAYLSVHLLLANPVLYYMQITNGFNQILEDITAYDALTKFESWCDSTFANSFQWTKVAADYKKNNWRYEQILTRTQSDLLIPNQLILNYKLWNTFGYYFFDDFRHDDDAKADITGWLINLGNIELLKTKNQMRPETGDVFLSNKFIHSEPIVDAFNIMFQRNPSVIVKGHDVECGFKKQPGTQTHPQDKAQSKSNKQGKRTYKSIQSDLSTGNAQVTEHMIVYAPDDPSNGLDRFDEIRNQLRYRLHAVESYYQHDCHLDFIQFGFRYNQIPYDPSLYLHVPITICHLFIRDTGPVPIFIHNMRYQMLVFSQDEKQ